MGKGRTTKRMHVTKTKGCTHACACPSASTPRTPQYANTRDQYNGIRRSARCGAGRRVCTYARDQKAGHSYVAHARAQLQHCPFGWCLPMPRPRSCGFASRWVGWGRREGGGGVATCTFVGGWCLLAGNRWGTPGPFMLVQTQRSATSVHRRVADATVPANLLPR